MLAEPLTDREREILALLADGHTNREIAATLHLAEKTVKWYNTQIYEKLGISNRREAVEQATTLGLLDTVPDDSQPTARNNLPTQTTPFIGRQQELTDIADLLANPATRILTILAPGGMGKTRLGLAAAEGQLRRFADGVFFVPLAPLSSPDDIVTTIAEHVGFSFYGSDPPQQQLLDYFRERQTLLLLDNFEHLLDGAPLVTDIVQAAPAVRVLATSREKLNLSGETVFTLSGLHFPDWETPEDALEYDAVKLFMQSTHRARPDFELQVDDLDTLARICRLTAGMPLGIVLAAGWVDVLALEQIAAEIQQGIDILETEMRDVPERQRSVRATFNYSWNRLADTDRAVFMKLSIFRGGFTAEAAQVVAGADLRELRKLVNKALVQALPTGRYDIHELLRQFGADQLARVPQVFEQTQDRHCDYYVGYMQHQWQALLSPQQSEILDEIETEHHNVISAWKHAVNDINIRALRDMALPLWYYAVTRLSRQEIFPLFEQAAEALRTLPNNRDAEIVRGHMLARQGWFYFGNITVLQAKTLIEQGLTLLRKADDCPEEMVVALHAQAMILGYHLDQYEVARQAAVEGLRIARDHNIAWGIGHCLFHEGLCTYGLGDLEQARKIGEHCHQVAEDAGDVWISAVCAVHLMAPLAIALQDYDEAERQLQQGYQWFQELGRPWGSAIACQLSAQVGLLTKDEDKATHWLRQALIHHQQDSRYSRELCETLILSSQLFASQGRQEIAIEILAVIHRHHMIEGGVHERVVSDLQALQADLPADIYATAVARADSLDMDSVVRNVLAELDTE